MKFGQLLEYNKRKIFLQKLCRRWDRETSSRLLFIFKKCLIWGKSKWSAAYFQYISIALSLEYNKNKLYKTLNYWSRDMLNFNFVVCLPLLLEILGNMCITIGVIKYEISLIFLIKPFLYIPKSPAKTWIFWKQKELFRWNKNHFSSFLKDFQLPKIASDLRVRL